VYFWTLSLTKFITGGWGDAPMPICVGHEVIGKAVRVGKDVKTIKVGGM
jgi:alcohol dehydrogenase (NADP+)